MRGCSFGVEFHFELVWKITFEGVATSFMRIGGCGDLHVYFVRVLVGWVRR